MKEVKSYQTTDMQLFTNREEAMKHELMLTLRGLIQSATVNFSPTNTITVTQASKAVIDNLGKVNEALVKYNTSMRRMKRSQVAKVPVVVQVSP